MTPRPVADHAGLVELSGGDPWLRWGLPPGPSPSGWYDPTPGLLAIARTSAAHGRSVALLRATAGPATDPAGGPAAGPPAGGTTAGPSPDAVRRLLAAVPGPADGWLTVPEELVEPARAALPPSGPDAGWDWMWTVRAPEPRPAEAEVTDLDAADPTTAAALTALLSEHSPRHSAVPGAAAVAGWVGVRRRSGLVACAAWFEEVPGVPLLASVAVHPDARRQGLAAAMTSLITRRALAAGAPAVTVDLYADNDAARRVYHGLGFTLAHRFTSWPR